MSTELNKNSYAYLIPVVIGAQAVLAFTLIWQIGIWPTIHFNALAEKACLIASLLMTLVAVVLVWRYKKPLIQQKKKREWPKLVLGVFIASGVVLVHLFAAAIYLTSAVPGSYISAYEYSPSGRYSCSGIKVFDAQLNKRIKVCQPGGSYGGGQARVDKRSGPLGIVVTSSALL